MKRRITALFIAMITTFASMPANLVFADTIELDEMPEIQETDIIQESDILQETDLAEGAFSEFDEPEYAEGYCDPETELSELPDPMNSASVNDIGSDLNTGNKATRNLDAYISRKGNDESRSYYYHGFAKKPTNLYYKSSIGSAKIVKVGNNNYAIKFTFKKNVKSSVTITYKYLGYKRSIKIINKKIQYSCAAKNIKLGKIRLSNFSRNFFWAERPVNGRIEITPAKGWKLYGVYKGPAFGKATGVLHNGDKIKLKKYEEARIYFQNKKTKKYVVYTYRAFT